MQLLWSIVSSTRLFLALIVVCGTASLAPSQELAGRDSCGNDINLTPSSVDLAKEGHRIRDAVRCLINADRTKFNREVLRDSQKLTLAADGHAADAARDKWWVKGADSHTNPQTKSTIGSRIAAQGYCPGRPHQVWETTYTGTGGDSATPAAAVNWWMNISTFGHREILLKPEARQLGIGFRGEGADETVKPGTLMGTYVVDFGDCTIHDPLSSPGAQSQRPPQQSNAMVEVRFTTMRIHDCPEIGKCDWKLRCKLDDNPETELIGLSTAGGASDVPINAPLTRPVKLPVRVTCSVFEHDGAFLFFDDPVWEHVGTRTETVTDDVLKNDGRFSFQINQNPSEGNVTIHMKVTQLGVSESPLTELPSLPQRPTGCRVPDSSTPNCGGITLTCDAPLPFADEFVVSGGGVRIYRVVSEAGLINAEYSSEGEASLAVCARNRAGIACSTRFAVTLGPAFCVNPPVRPGACPSGEQLCPATAACRPIGQCALVQ